MYWSKLDIHIQNQNKKMYDFFDFNVGDVFVVLNSKWETDTDTKYKVSKTTIVQNQLQN